ncbi:hypothetical protein J4225_02260 [Candidatus Pacearchaeota archaeon]|nr:hypothetical protein [Candidatus Pacearchaeota archaeon]
MINRRANPWIGVYPFEGRGLIINDINLGVELNPEMAEYIEKLWQPKAEKGWKSSWIAFIDKFYCSSADKEGYLDNKSVVVIASAIPFYYVDGINKAIEQGKNFAPEQGYVNCLSVGFPTATKDGKVIFQRRAPDVHCPNILIHEPCGYMTSLAFASRAECDKPEHANDPRLFNLETQLDFRKKEIADTFGLEAEAVIYEPAQDCLAAGWLTTEMYFSTTGKIDASEKELKLPEKGEFFFVPFEYLKDLINNQGRLSKINPEGYRPEDPREIPLIDESLVGLIWGYEKLTGEKLDIEETVDRLGHGGLDIRVMDTSFRKSYVFPTRF